MRFYHQYTQQLGAFNKISKIYNKVTANKKTIPVAMRKLVETSFFIFVISNGFFGDTTDELRNALYLSASFCVSCRASA